LVIEPLRALITSQIEQLKRGGVKVEKLLTFEEATGPLEPPGRHRLQQLAAENIKRPLMIFSTPEIIENCLSEVRWLADKHLLSLIVIDEFDYIEECDHTFRSAYTTLVENLKEGLQPSQVPFLFLSATGSSEFILEILSNGPKLRRPILFQAANVLPKNHIYKGEIFG
jgi:superfamily II DNA helicase RecQ